MNKLISEEEKYDGLRFKIVRKIYERESGQRYIRECVEPGNAVVILPVTPDNEIIFEKQYREAIDKTVLEIPAGIIDEGELPEEAAKRELEEEVGIKAESLEFLTSYYPSCGYTNEKIYIYIARSFSKGTVNLDEDEEIESIEKIHIDDCLKMVLENKFEHASVNIAILMYYFKYCNGGKNG